MRAGHEVEVLLDGGDDSDGKGEAERGEERGEM